jgi:hypothetical protein
MNQAESLAFQILKKKSSESLIQLEIPQDVIARGRDFLQHAFAYADTPTKLLLQMVGLLFSTKEKGMVPTYLIFCEYLFHNYEKHGLTTEEVADAVYITERYYEVQNEMP